MVKVELEFISVDAAIVALSKLSSVVAKVASMPIAEPAAPAPGKPERKPRNDAGKPRGARKNAGATETPPEPQATAAVVPAPEAAAPTTPAEPDKGRTSGVVSLVAAAPKEEDAQAALAKVFEAHGLPRAQEVLQRHGVSRLRDLLPEQRAAFIKEAEEVAATKPAVK